MKEVGSFYDQNCFDFAEKRVLFLDAKAQFLSELLSIVSRNNSNNARMSSELEAQLKERYGAQVREAKEMARAEQIRLEGVWKEALQSKSEVEANNEILKEQLDQLKEAKSKDNEES